ncbi:hypothetical protein G6F50_018403 [Rhizopus delemar]|uniref:Uncharacterized protein n=1 Tax=Rhizopus delemar TaxID=936053 RepID=A0A9P7BZE5_9FUNG|nr:hypothetical protein G6F50_018403 [Rhizopus delemar]
MGSGNAGPHRNGRCPGRARRGPAGGHHAAALAAQVRGRVKDVDRRAGPRDRAGVRIVVKPFPAHGRQR